MAFAFEKLEVFQIALRAVVVLDRIALGLPPGRSAIAQQIHRAALSVPLNIAEGSGGYGRLEKARFYIFARRSATESAAILKVMQSLGLGRAADIDQATELLDRVGAMLTKMIIKRQP